MHDTKILEITHTSTYSYDTPVHYALQQLRLIPRAGNGQRVIEWNSTISGGEKQLTFNDQFLNQTELVKVDAGATQIEIISHGVVEIENRHGVVGAHSGFTPMWLFLEQTPLTAAGNQVRKLAARVKNTFPDLSDVELMHKLVAEIAKIARYETGTTDSQTTAEVALTAGSGVCQDHAHIMIAVARQLGFAARYVSGYLLMDGQVEQSASHAWCEIHVESLGWVGFDVSNGISPDARYVRVATGRDYRDAAPILGLRQGAGQENLNVALQIQQ